MKKLQPAGSTTNSILNDALNRRDPAQSARTRTRMLLAAKIYAAMQVQGISKSGLAGLLSQQPSVITKWLSGTHNFTVDTLTDIERILNIELFHLEMDNSRKLNTSKTPYNVPGAPPNSTNTMSQMVVNEPEAVYKKSKG